MKPGGGLLVPERIAEGSRKKEAFQLVLANSNVFHSEPGGNDSVIVYSR